MGGDRTPDVSVVMTCFNQEAYLERAVRSVLNQDQPNVEIIVVDDGSTDGSYELLHAFEREYGDRFWLLTHTGRENRGIVRTYQLGIERVRAPLTAFLECDDAWSTNYLSEKVKIFHRYSEVGVVFSPLRIRGENGYGRDMVFRQALLGLLFPRRRAFRNFKNLLRHNNVAAFSTFVARSDLLSAVPPPGTGRLPYLDWWVLLFLSMQAAFYFDTRSHVDWRVSPSSYLGRVSFRDLRESLIDFLEEMYASAGRLADRLDENETRCLERKQTALPLFAEFFREPGAARFARLFAADPRWALESLVSYHVNSRKHG